MTATIDLTEVISPGFTENVVKNILLKKTGLSNVTFRIKNLGAPSKKGDSYLSTVTRFTVVGTGNSESEVNKDVEVHVIVKSIPKSQARMKSFRSLDFFANEINFYERVWPALDAFQKSKNLPELYDSIPLCLATFADGRNDFIAMEDLNYEGYSVFDRTASLDVDNALLILRNFAKFHAISVAYREQNPKEFEEIVGSLQETYVDEKLRGWYTNAMKKFLRVSKDAIEKELPPSYLKKFEEVTSQDLYGNVSKLLKRRTTLCAITHGDCWAPNFLVKQSNSTRKLALIDFQLMRFASLTTDILFFLLTCVDPIVCNQNWDFLLTEYHHTFVDVLKHLGSKLNVTLELLKDEIKMNGLFALLMCNEAVVMSLVDDEDVVDIDTLEGDEGIPVDQIWKIEPIKDKEKRQRVADFLKLLIDNEFI